MKPKNLYTKKVIARQSMNHFLRFSILCLLATLHCFRRDLVQRTNIYFRLGNDRTQECVIGGDFYFTSSFRLRVFQCCPLIIQTVYFTLILTFMCAVFFLFSFHANKLCSRSLKKYIKKVCIRRRVEAQKYKTMSSFLCLTS